MMPRPKSLTMTDGELRLMRVLWDKGQATVGDVVEALKTRPKPAYNTVLTLLRIMEKKGYVTHRKDGRAFIFLPMSTAPMRAAARCRRSSTVFSMARPRLLMLNLLEEAQLSPEALKQLKERIEEA